MRDLLGLQTVPTPAIVGVVLRLGETGGGVPQYLFLVPDPMRGTSPAQPPERAVQVIGLEVSAADFQPLLDQLAQIGLSVQAGEHAFLPQRVVTLQDPDGNQIEIAVGIAVPL